MSEPACVNIEKNRDDCVCTYDCDKRGVCCECVRSHLAHQQLPGCFFPASEERSYDRSFRHFVQMYKHLI
jgi:hypothetical protein